MARTKRKINPVRPAPVLSEPQQRIYHAGGYVRLSVEDSGKPGADTIDMQREFIRSFVESQKDMQLYCLYRDNGWTGTNFDRPEFERMMEDVRTGKVDCIVVRDLSRFGRSYLETGNYLEQIFPILDVRFIAVNDHFDTLTAERSQDGYIIPLKNIINAAYSKDIARKISPALATKQQYQADMERAQARLDELDRQQRSEQRQTVENPWLTACAPFLEEQELTEEMTHTLIDRVEIDTENHVTVTLRYRDEYHALLQLLETDGKAGLV